MNLKLSIKELRILRDTLLTAKTTANFSPEAAMIINVLIIRLKNLEAKEEDK